MTRTFSIRMTMAMAIVFWLANHILVLSRREAVSPPTAGMRYATLSRKSVGLVNQDSQLLPRQSLKLKAACHNILGFTVRTIDPAQGAELDILLFIFGRPKTRLPRGAAPTLHCNDSCTLYDGYLL